MNDDELAAISALAEAATPGPWGVVAPSQIPWHDDGAEWWVEFSHGDSTLMGEADAAFIAAARSAVPALVAALAEARAESEAKDKKFAWAWALVEAGEDRSEAIETALAEAHRTLAERNDGTHCVCEGDGGCIDYYDESRSGDCVLCHALVESGSSLSCPAMVAASRSGAESAGEQR